MTETKTKKNYTTPGSHNLQIPAKNHFLRYACEILAESGADFCTNHAGRPGMVVDKIASSISWTYKNEKNRKDK